MPEEMLAMNKTKRQRRAKTKKYQQAQIRHGLHTHDWRKIQILRDFLPYWLTWLHHKH